MIRTLFVTGALVVLALATPLPWGALWVVVPLVVAIGLLFCWRWGSWGVLVPVSLMVAAMVAAGPLAAWAWWVPVAALSGCWMGLREEGGGPAAGRRAWMLLPLLLLAAGLPWTISYPELVQGVERYLQVGERQLIESSQEIGYQGEKLQALRRVLEDGAQLRTRYLPKLLPSMLFLWMAVLVVAGRDVSARIADHLKWPELSRARLSEWRLPDGAIWLLIAGLTLVLAGFDVWLPTAWTLMIVPGLGYCVQGVAVVESLLLLRGVPPSIITLTLLFVLVMALPVFMLATACVGLSDVWLDYRRLEAVPDGDSS